MINKLGASNSQAVRASCCFKVSRLLVEVIAIMEKMSGFAFPRKPTHQLHANYWPASSTHFAAAASRASFGDFTPVNAS
jgi:hypothetical protein